MYRDYYGKASLVLRPTLGSTLRPIGMYPDGTQADADELYRWRMHSTCRGSGQTTGFPTSFVYVGITSPIPGFGCSAGGTFALDTTDDPYVPSLSPSAFPNMWGLAVGGEGRTTSAGEVSSAEFDVIQTITLERLPE